MISVICPTYGRISSLEEAIQSFINQNYENKEMIIVNDCDKIVLRYNHPQIKIFNLSSRFGSLGEKRNFCIQQSCGDMIVTLDDDDILLPNHLDICSQKLLKYSWWCGMNSFIFNRDDRKIRMSNAILPNIGAFRKSIFPETRFPDVSFNENGLFLERLYQKRKGAYSKLNLQDISYICGFTPSMSSSYHTQSMFRLNKDTFYSDIHSYITNSIQKQELKSGEIELYPHWKYDYIDMKNKFVIQNCYAFDNHY